MNARLLTVLSLVLATAVAAGTGALVERVGALLQSESAATLGGDLVLLANDPPGDTVRAYAMQRGLSVAEEISLPTLAFYGDESALVGLRAVDKSWPLRGSVRALEASVDAPISTRPASGTVWVASALAQQLGLRIGDALDIGAARFAVAAFVDEAPGRGNAGFSSLAPQVMIARDDLEQAELMVDGARSRWYLYVAGPAAALADFRDWAANQSLRISAPGEMRPEIGSALKRAENLLDLASLCSLVLLAAVIFLLGRYRYPAWAYETAVLRSLGASQRRIWKGLGWPWVRDAGLAVGAGLMLAIGGQMLLDFVLGRMEAPRLPMAGWRPYALAAVASFLIALLQLPALRQAVVTPPAHILRQAKGAESGFAGAAVWSALMLLAVGAVVSGDARVLISSVGIVLGGGAALAAMAWGVLRLLPKQGPLTALGQMQQRHGRVAVQAGALGLGVSILLLLGGLQQQVIAPWQAQLPPDAPNRFVINIQPHQQESFAGILADGGVASARLMPMVRGRLVGLNGQRVQVDDFDDPETRRWINRDFNLSSAATLGTDNKLYAGAFWAPDSDAREVSATDYVVERLGVDLGSTLTLDVAGTEYTYTVTSLREVQWDSMQPNFFLLVPPAALPQAGANWITSYFQTPEQKPLDRELVLRFPNITVLNLERLIAEIRQITGRALTALQMVFGFTLISGALLVLGMLLGELPERQRQVAILRALGIRRRPLMRLVAGEFALLGALAGVGAMLIVQISLAALAVGVFDLEWKPAASGILLPPLLVAMGTALTGWLMLRAAVEAPPGDLLRTVGGGAELSGLA